MSLRIFASAVSVRYFHIFKLHCKSLLFAILANAFDYENIDSNAEDVRIDLK